MRLMIDGNILLDVLQKRPPHYTDSSMISLIFHFEDLKASDLMAVAAMQWEDFEDALQSVTADRIHADHIITRNVKDYSKSTVAALTPSEFLKQQ